MEEKDNNTNELEELMLEEIDIMKILLTHFLMFLHLQQCVSQVRHYASESHQ